MDQISRGLSQVQENDCRAALTKFIDKNDLSDWGSTVKVEETSAGRYRVKIELTPPTSAGLPTWSVDEIEIADASVDVAAEVDKLLEIGYQARLQDAKVQESQYPFSLSK